MRPRKTGWAIALGGALAVIGSSPRASATSSYYGEWITSWSGCCVSEPGLNQTDDQINEFAGILDQYSGTRYGLYGNTDVWAADTIEDQLNGADYLEADQADIYAYSGHGAAPNDGSGNQTYQSPKCLTGYSYNTCWFDSSNARWGETYGSYSTNPGHMRWALLATCYSVDVDPYNQWNETFWDAGTEYILGYRGLSADSFTTDEVPQDWANSALINSTAFKSAWFDAAADLWVDDTAEVVAGGTNVNNAIARRDYLNHLYARRVNTVGWGYVAWAWHQG